MGMCVWGAERLQMQSVFFMKIKMRDGERNHSSFLFITLPAAEQRLTAEVKKALDLLDGFIHVLRVLEAMICVFDRDEFDQVVVGKGL